MAKTITIEFTDAQWELIKEHYPKQYYDDSYDMNSHSAWTEELVAKWLKFGVQSEVNDQMHFKAGKTNSFDV